MSSIQTYKKFLLFALAFFLLGAPASYGQTTLLIPNVQAQRGDTISIPVQVINFQKVVSLQFTLSWDTTVLEFLRIKENLLPKLDENDYNTQNDRLLLLWVDESLSGIDIVDSSNVLTMDFVVTGEAGSISNLSFVNAPAAPELADINGAKATNWINGSVTVPLLSATSEVTEQGVDLKTFPNPFTAFFICEFTLSQDGVVMWQICDLWGRIVKQDADFFVRGTHRINISNGELLKPGKYFLRIAQQNRIETIGIIKQ